jgi:hypothetical protein
MKMRDVNRACKFSVGTEVCTYPYQNDSSGWSPIVVGKIVKILVQPNIQTKDPGEFEVSWEYIGASWMDPKKEVLPNPISGHLLRFRA